MVLYITQRRISLAALHSTWVLIDDPCPDSEPFDTTSPFPLHCTFYIRYRPPTAPWLHITRLVGVLSLVVQSCIKQKIGTTWKGKELSQVVHPPSISSIDIGTGQFIRRICSVGTRTRCQILKAILPKAFVPRWHTSHPGIFPGRTTDVGGVHLLQYSREI